MAKLGGIWLEIRAKQDALKKDLNEAKETVSDTADRMESRLTKFGLAAAAGVSALGYAAIRVGTEFESNMKTVQAYSGSTGKELEGLTAIAREMGATTEFSATEAAQGLQFLAAAGLTSSQQMAALPGVIDLATASQTDLATATDISTDTLTGFNLGVGELSRVSDALINTTSRTNTNLMQLGEAMKYVAPVSGQLGISIESTSSMLGVLANSGLKASMGGTSLRSILLQVDKAAKKLGMEGAASLVDVLKEMEEQQTSTTEQTEIFGKIATTGVGILRNNIDKVAELTEKLETNQGATKSLADIMRDSLGTELKTLASSMEENLLKVFDIFKEDASGIITNLTDITREVGNWVEANDELIRSKIVDTMKSFGSSVLSIAGFINKNPDILKYGLFGFAIFGRKGAVLGALFGKVVDLADRFSKNLGAVSVEAKGLSEALIAAGVMTYAEGVEKANDNSRTFTITNQETGESIEKVDNSLGGLITSMLEATKGADNLKDSTDGLGNSVEDLGVDTGNAVPVIKDIADNAKKASGEIDYFAQSVAEMDVIGFVSMDKEQRTFFENMSAGWHAALGPVRTWADLSISLGVRASRGVVDAFSDNLFDVLKGDFDNLGDVWEGLMDNMLQSFTDNIAKMVIQGGGFASQMVVVAGATVTSYLAFSEITDNILDDVGDALKTAFSAFDTFTDLTVSTHGRGSERLGGLTFRDGKIVIPGGTPYSMEQENFGLRGRYTRQPEGGMGYDFGFIDAALGDKDLSADVEAILIGATMDMADTVYATVADIATVVPDFGEALKTSLQDEPIDVGFYIKNPENIDEVITDATGAIGEGVNLAYENALIQTAVEAGIITLGAREDMLQGIDDWLEKMAIAAADSGKMISTAFGESIKSGSFEDFGKSMKNQIYDFVFNGMVSALERSEAYMVALQPFFAGITDAFTSSMESGTFDSEIFESAITPLLETLPDAIDALQPAFDAVSSTLGTVQDAIFGDEGAINASIEKMAEAAQSSGTTIGAAFKAGIETSSFEDFGKSMKNQIYDFVSTGMVSALENSEVYMAALQPFFAGITDAFTDSMESGSFDSEAFEAAITPLLDSLPSTIDALQPAFDAVSSTVGTIKDAIFGDEGAINDSIEKMEAAAIASGSTIGEAFKAGIESDSFEDFGKSIKQTIYSSVLDGMISALMESEMYKSALQPVFAGITDAFDSSMVDGNFDAGVFDTQIAPILGGLDGIITGMQPAFDAISGVMGGIKDILIPETDEEADAQDDTTSELITSNEYTKEGNELVIYSNTKLDDIDLILSDISNKTETGNTDIVNSINGLSDKMQAAADRPIIVNTRVTNTIDGEDLKSTVEDVIVDREERELTDGERTASL